jgi:hypothetical protein
MTRARYDFEKLEIWNLEIWSLTRRAARRPLPIGRGEEGLGHKILGTVYMLNGERHPKKSRLDRWLTIR